MLTKVHNVHMLTLNMHYIVSLNSLYMFPATLHVSPDSRFR